MPLRKISWRDSGKLEETKSFLCFLFLSASLQYSIFTIATRVGSSSSSGISLQFSQISRNQAHWAPSEISAPVSCCPNSDFWVLSLMGPFCKPLHFTHLNSSLHPSSSRTVIVSCVWYLSIPQWPFLIFSTPKLVYNSLYYLFSVKKINCSIPWLETYLNLLSHNFFHFLNICEYITIVFLEAFFFFFFHFYCYLYLIIFLKNLHIFNFTWME